MLDIPAGSGVSSLSKEKGFQKSYTSSNGDLHKVEHRLQWLPAIEVNL